MKYLLAVAALTTAANTFLSCTMAIAEGNWFPQQCIIASKPTNCAQIPSVLRRIPKNDFEIYYPGGLTGIRFGESGTREGSTAFFDGIPGTIQLSHGAEVTAAVTISTVDGRIHSFIYED